MAKRYIIGYKGIWNNDENGWFKMPDFVYDSYDEAQEQCDKLKSVSPFFENKVFEF